MKRSIHGARLRFRDIQWEFSLIKDRTGLTPGVMVRQGIGPDPERVQQLTVFKHHLPAFITFLRWAQTEIQERDRAKREAARLRDEIGAA